MAARVPVVGAAEASAAARAVDAGKVLNVARAVEEEAVQVGGAPWEVDGERLQVRAARARCLNLHCGRHRFQKPRRETDTVRLRRRPLRALRRSWLNSSSRPRY